MGGSESQPAPQAQPAAQTQEVQQVPQPAQNVTYVRPGSSYTIRESGPGRFMGPTIGGLPLYMLILIFVVLIMIGGTLSYLLITGASIEAPSISYR